MRRFLPSLSALQAFDSAARHLSFTRAAEDLMLTQSAISRQINNLEAHLGLRLFERTGSRLVLTDSGRNLAEDVRASLDRLEEVAIDAVRGRKAETSMILGAHSTFARRWLLPRLQGFIRANPAIPLEIADLPPGTDPEASEADIAVLRGHGSWSHVRARKLFAEKLVVIAAPALRDQIGPTDAPLDFRRLPSLQNSSRPSLWLAWLRASNRPYEGAIQGLRLPRNELLIEAALAGLGLAVVPFSYVSTEIAAGRLFLPFGDPVPSGEAYWVVMPERKAHRPNLLIMRDWLLREARASEGETDVSDPA